MRLTAAGVLLAALGPAFYRWLKRATDDGGSALEAYAGGSDGNRMLPAPEPQPASVTPAGEGRRATSASTRSRGFRLLPRTTGNSPSKDSSTSRCDTPGRTFSSFRVPSRSAIFTV
ncbi:hypothetical protein N6H14_16740 [Paenibacillus sp. CC-CFT747]|nr:hypothetical protein N6H14_16740 [Paenibacillus sp. CC-CFT747]